MVLSRNTSNLKNTTNSIKVYGASTSGQKTLVSIIENIFRNASIPVVVKEITDIEVFLDLKLKAIPSIQYNNGEIFPLKFDHQFNTSIRNCLSTILAQEDYGKLKRLLIPIDYSTGSIHAFMYGHRLATEIGLVAKVMHVDPKFRIKNRSGNNFKTESVKKFDKFIEKVDIDWSSDLLKSAFIEKKFTLGIPASCILEEINESNPEMIVMGRNGHTQDNQFIGSVSKHILDQADHPILIVPTHSKFKKPKKIICYSQDNQRPKQQSNWVSTYINKFNPELMLMNKTNTSFPIDSTLKLSSISSDLNINYLPHDRNYLSNLLAKKNIDLVVFKRSSVASKTRKVETNPIEKMLMHSSIPILFTK